MPLCGNNAPWGGVCGRIRPPGPSHRLGPRASKACPNAAVHSFGPAFQAGPKCLPVIPKGLAGIACQTFWYDWETRGCGALRRHIPVPQGATSRQAVRPALKPGISPAGRLCRPRRAPRRSPGLRPGLRRLKK